MVDREAPPGLFHIRAVSEMTGVNAATLRAWERRYGLLRPQRSDAGHRLYSGDDVRHIRRIVGCLNRGMSPSRVGALLRDADATARDSEAADWSERQVSAIEAIERFDEEALDDLYRTALSANPFVDVTESLTVPVLETLGRRWEAGEGLVAEEHFFHLYVRNALGSRLFHRVRGRFGRTLVAGCIAGERHDIGLLLFCLGAEAEGFRVVNLGADTPLAELPHVAAACNAAAIVLSASYLDDAADWSGSLAQLTSSDDFPVFVGGRESAARPTAIEAAGAAPLGSNIREGIRRLRQLLGPSASVAGI